MIAKADKSNTTLAIDKNKYINEVQFMLSDKNTYGTLKRDPTNTIHKKVDGLVKFWKNENYVNESMSNSLKSSNLPFHELKIALTSLKKSRTQKFHLGTKSFR